MPGAVKPVTITIPLTGAGGERVSLRGTLRSHGLAWLPPNEIADDERAVRTTLLGSDGVARTVDLREPSPGALAITIAGRLPHAGARAEIVASVRAMFALDDDLSPFYVALRSDAEFAFVLDTGIGDFSAAPRPSKTW